MEQQTVLTVSDIAAQAIDEMGDVFYQPDPNVDGYDQEALRKEAQQIVEDAINHALDQQREQKANNLAIVLRLARRALADQADLVITQRAQLPEAEFTAAFAAAKAIEEALEAVAHIGGFSDVHEAIMQSDIPTPPMRKAWTVIGGYFDYDFDNPDNVWVKWVYADTPQQAAQTAVNKIGRNTWGADTGPQPVVLTVFEGWRADKLADKRGEIQEE